jgi:hypothetical protein
MSMNLQIKQETGYLSVTIDGDVTRDDLLPILAKIRDACITNQQPNILIDCSRLQGLMSTSDRFSFAEFFAHLFKERITELQNKAIRIACIASEPLVDSQKFGENVVVNRGLDFKVFPMLDHGLSWLGISPGKQ